MQFRFTRMIVLVVGVAVATSACGRYSWSNLRSAKAFKDGLALYSGADYRGAIDEFEHAVGTNPGFQAAGFAYFYLGNSHDMLYRPARKGEPENDAHLGEAVDYYRQAIDQLASSDMEQAPEFRKRSYEYLISAYGPDKLDDFSMAEPLARELISIEPEEPSNYQALARLYEEQGMYEEAEQMFAQAIEVRPDDPAGYQLLAGYFNRQGEFDKTIEAFMKRAELEPNNPEAWHTMGTYQYEKVFRDKSLTRDQASAYIEAGLEAEDKALELNADYFEAVTFKNLLLRLKANLERNPAAQRALLEEADELRERAEALQARQAGELGN
jgi:tetratricopeptide (TPR) repeat protein